MSQDPFEFISEKEKEQAQLQEKLEKLEGRKALLDPHQQEYKLIKDSIKELQIKLAYLQREIDRFVNINSQAS